MNELKKNSQRIHLVEILTTAALTSMGTLNTKYGLLIMGITLVRAYAVFKKQASLNG